MKVEEDIKKYLTPDERAQLQKAAQCLLDYEAGKLTDEKVKKDAEAQIDLFARTIAERKQVQARYEDFKKYLTPEEQAQVEDANKALAKYKDDMREYEEARVRKEKVLQGYDELINESNDSAERLALIMAQEAFSATYPLRKPDRPIYQEGRLKYFTEMIQQRKAAEQQRKEYEHRVAVEQQRWELQRQQEEKSQRIRELIRRMEIGSREIQLRQQANAEIEKFKASLYREKQDPMLLFSKWIKDSRYLGLTLESLLLPDQRRQLDTAVRNWVSANAVPGGSTGRFIAYEYKASYFLLPRAEYILYEDEDEDEVPCLDFSFDVFAVVEIIYWKKIGKIERGGYSVIGDLEKPQFLGYWYQLLTLGDFSWEKIPVSLVQGLIDGELQPPGAKVSEIGRDGDIFYSPDGVEDEIRIPEDFRNYLIKAREKGGLAALGVIPPEVDTIIKHLPQMPAGGPSRQVETADKDVLAALLSLGFKAAEAKAAIASTSFPENAGFEEKMKLLLQTLGGGKLT